MSWRGLLIFMSVAASSDLISHEGQGSSGQVVGLTEASTLVTSGRLSLLKLSRVDSGGGSKEPLVLSRFLQLEEGLGEELEFYSQSSLQSLRSLVPASR